MAADTAHSGAPLSSAAEKLLRPEMPAFGGKAHMLGGERPQDADVLLPRGGSWSSLSSISTLSYLPDHDPSLSPPKGDSPLQRSSLEEMDGGKRPSDESPLEFYNRESNRQGASPPASVSSDGTSDASHAASAAATAFAATVASAPASGLLAAASRVVLPPLASLFVTLYDLVIRSVMVSYYIVGLDAYRSADEYLHSKALKSTRRYVEACRGRFEAAVDSGKIRVEVKPSLNASDIAFATSVLRAKHGMPLPLVWAWRGFVSLLSHAPGAVRLTTVTDVASGALVGLFLEYRQGGAMHHFITALVEHEASREHGIYVAKYHDLLACCIRDAIPLLRLGPTTADLKAGLGAVPLPLMVVGSCVWARLEQRCSVVCFGIFTSIALFLYLLLTQWHLDASGVGALTLSELSVLYVCCMGCVKLLPLWSIGLRKIVANPRKYLLQTSFYAQGVIPGAVLGIALISAWRKASPLLLLDGLSLFLLVGEFIGRLGCHFYGCCFGRAWSPDPSVFSRWSVVYIHKTSSVARLRPEYLVRPLLPTQVLQSLYALVMQLGMLAVVHSCQAAATGADGSTSTSWLRVGMVGVMALVVYSIGRLIFFTLREDENFKSNRSYTTAYMALATLAGCALVQAYSYLLAPASTIALAGIHETRDAVDGFGRFFWSYVCLAAVAAATTFVVQGLHHHDRVGVFPDVHQLLFGAPKAASHGQQEQQQQQQPSQPPAAVTAPRKKGSDVQRQVWSSWQSDKDN